MQAGGKVIGVEPQFLLMQDLYMTRDYGTDHDERYVRKESKDDRTLERRHCISGRTGTLEEITEVMSKVSLKHLDAPYSI